MKMKPSYELISDLITRKTGVVLDQETKLLIKDLIIDREELKEKINKLADSQADMITKDLRDWDRQCALGATSRLQKKLLELLEVKDKDNKKES